MIMSAIAAKLKRRSKNDFKGRHYEASLIVQAVSWYLRYPPAIADSHKEGLLLRLPLHYVTKHLQQGIQSDHFRVKKNMPRVCSFRSFNTARRTIQGFEAMLWLRKGFGFAGAWTVREQNRLLAHCFGLQAVNKT